MHKQNSMNVAENAIEGTKKRPHCKKADVSSLMTGQEFTRQPLMEKDQTLVSCNILCPILKTTGTLVSWQVGKNILCG